MLTVYFFPRKLSGSHFHMQMSRLISIFKHKLKALSLIRHNTLNHYKKIHKVLCISLGHYVLPVWILKASIVHESYLWKFVVLKVSPSNIFCLERNIRQEMQDKQSSLFHRLDSNVLIHYKRTSTKLPVNWDGVLKLFSGESWSSPRAYQGRFLQWEDYNYFHLFM